MSDYHKLSEAKFNVAGLPLSKEELDFIRATDQWPEAWVIASSSLYSSKILEQALGKHVAALRESSDAANRYSRGLRNATRWLVVATIILALATIGLVVATRAGQSKGSRFCESSPATERTTR